MTRQDFEVNDFSAYHLLRPITEFYSEACHSSLANVNEFCEIFENSNIVELSNEFYQTKEMCVDLRVRSGIQLPRQSFD